MQTGKAYPGDLSAQCVCYWLYDESCVDPYKDGYVGISCDVEGRIICHRRSKNFPSNFKWKILYNGTVLDCLEQEERFRPFINMGWNKACGGDIAGVAHVGLKRSKSVRTKMSLSAKRRGTDWLHTPEVRAAAAKSNIGKKRTIITRQKISEKRKQYLEKHDHYSSKGRKHSAETRALISQKRKQYYEHHDHPCKGRKHSAETIAKMKETKRQWFAQNDSPLKGRKHTQEARQNMSEGRRKYLEQHPIQKDPEELRQKKSQAQLKRWAQSTPEARQRQCEILKLAREQRFAG